eukprot:TRINITY_DN53312_c0_g1_i1.p1 TRINITY_DN53312_c0_g1~~TRINITY_DN53312_c0_g1_i1.p1  ORF type:complete len:155 (-),score=43.30 TRINITY_DN53312_c0_g1_i1:11-475(-)
MPSATWFMDAAAEGGGTASGTAKVITRSLMAIKEDQRPIWMSAKTEKEVCEIVTQSIVEAVEASYVVKDYLDAERSKGREFDDIYGEVKPYLDYVSRPLDETGMQPADPDGDRQFGHAHRTGGMNFAEQAARREAKKLAAPHRALQDWPAAPSF